MHYIFHKLYVLTDLLTLSRWQYQQHHNTRHNYSTETIPLQSQLTRQERVWALSLLHFGVFLIIPFTLPLTMISVCLQSTKETTGSRDVDKTNICVCIQTSIYTHTHVRAYKAQQYAMRESVPLDLQTSVSSGEHFWKGASHAVIKAIFIPAAVWLPQGHSAKDARAHTHRHTHIYTCIRHTQTHMSVHTYPHVQSITSKVTHGAKLFVKYVSLKLSVGTDFNTHGHTNTHKHWLPRGYKWSKTEQKNESNTPVHLCFCQKKLLTILTSLSTAK